MWRILPFPCGLYVVLHLAGCCGAQAARPAAPAAERAPGIDEEVARLFDHPYPEGEVPYDVQLSPDGSLLAYAIIEGAGDEAHGVLHLVEVESRQDRALWAEAEPAVESFAWFPEGDRLLVSADGDLWAQPVEAGAPRTRLTETASSEDAAELSPDGRRVAFVRDHDLYVLSLEDGTERRLTSDGSETLLNGEVDWVHEEELDLSQAFFWSPDGSRIAFLQFDQSAVSVYPVVRPGDPSARIVEQRYPLAGGTNPTVQLGLVAVEGEGAVTWLDVQPEDGGYVARVTWTPAGDRIAVTTLDRLQRHLQVVLVDPACSERRVLVDERDDSWVNLLDPPRFLGSADRFVWRSERDGHAHLYLYDGEGEPRQLTSGPWEVSDVSLVDQERRLVYFVGSIEGPSIDQVYSVSLEGGEPTRLSTEPGCHDPTFAPNGSRYVDVHSSLARPPVAEVHEASGELAFVVAEGARGSVPYAEEATAEILRVPGPDGIEYEARMIRPATLEPGRRYPVVVWVYNGPGAQIVRDEWRTKYLPWMRLLAARGVAVWSLDGRGTYGRGRDWEKALYGRLGEVELADQMAGIDYLRGLDWVDPARIAVFGWSYGGTMTLHMLLRRPGVFRAGVAVAPVTDWHLYDTIYTERYMMRPEDNPEGYASTALPRHAGTLEDPLLLVHGLSDDNVHVDNTTRMVSAFIDEGRRFDLMLYPGQTHGIASPSSRRHVFSTITTYLLEHLAQ